MEQQTKQNRKKNKTNYLLATIVTIVVSTITCIIVYFWLSASYGAQQTLLNSNTSSQTTQAHELTPVQPALEQQVPELESQEPSKQVHQSSSNNLLKQTQIATVSKAINYSEAELTNNNLRKYTFTAADINQKCNPCTNQCTDRSAEEKQSLLKFHTLLLSKNSSDAIKMMQEQSGEITAATLFPICSANHEFIPLVAKNNGVFALTSAGNGMSTYIAGNLSLGYITTDQDSIVLFEQAFDKYFDNTAYAEALTEDAFLELSDLRTQLVDQIEISIQNNAFQHAGLQKQYTQFLSHFE